jgi:hypothetical protein
MLGYRLQEETAASATLAVLLVRVKPELALAA